MNTPTRKIDSQRPTANAEVDALLPHAVVGRINEGKTVLFVQGRRMMKVKRVRHLTLLSKVDAQ